MTMLLRLESYFMEQRLWSKDIVQHILWWLWRKTQPFLCRSQGWTNLWKVQIRQKDKKQFKLQIHQSNNIEMLFQSLRVLFQDNFPTNEDETSQVQSEFISIIITSIKSSLYEIRTIQRFYNIQKIFV